MFVEGSLFSWRGAEGGDSRRGGLDCGDEGSRVCVCSGVGCVGDGRGVVASFCRKKGGVLRVPGGGGAPGVQRGSAGRGERG